MAIAIRVVVFVVGLLAFALTGLSGAQDFGVDTNSMLTKLGETPGDVAMGAQNTWGGLLGQLGGLIANLQGADPENPGAAAQYGPEGIVALVSALMMFFSAKR